MEFLIADVATRSLLMSFVKDNYGLGGMAREGMKSWLCAVWVDVALWPLCQAGAWHKVMLMLPFPRALFLFLDFIRLLRVFAGPLSIRIKTCNQIPSFLLVSHLNSLTICNRLIVNGVPSP